MAKKKNHVYIPFARDGRPKDRTLRYKKVGKFVYRLPNGRLWMTKTVGALSAYNRKLYAEKCGGRCIGVWVKPDAILEQGKQVVRW